MSSLVAGVFRFQNATYPIDESAGNVQIVVLRENGLDGDVHISWKTISGSATPGSDYTHRQGVIRFQAGEVRAIIIFQTD